MKRHLMKNLIGIGAVAALSLWLAACATQTSDVAYTMARSNCTSHRWIQGSTGSHGGTAPSAAKFARASIYDRAASWRNLLPISRQS